MAYYYDEERNPHLFKVGCAMRGRGEDLETIATELARENAFCSPPLDESELNQILRSVSRYSPNPSKAWLKDGSMDWLDKVGMP